ncbi:MAG: hypothetical protein PHP59_05430 [Methanofollis sp.]|uniref:hypothetical protein n=1 Tax=Methanofollis sp. TaxID=2052835 RepID=UPI0026230A1B|nr:hypothetical protein [Methanofollis sp.]MDD4254802.1 hypothetical protein [Methanofollis sp.]
MDMQRRDLLACCVLVLSLLACGCTGPGGDEAQPTPTPTPAPPIQAGSGVPQPVPTPPGEWDGKKPYDVKFVDPAMYHITPTVTATTTMVKQPNDLQVDKKAMKEYAKISSNDMGKVMTTEIYHIPFPYWELDYTADAKIKELARFAVEVRDAEDPNRLVAEIDLKRADFMASGTSQENTANSGTILLREGFRDYYFVIQKDQISSFSLVIKVPEKYLV